MSTQPEITPARCELEAAAETYAHCGGYLHGPGLQSCPMCNTIAKIIAKHTRCEGKTAQGWEERSKQIYVALQSANQDRKFLTERAEAAEARVKELESVQCCSCKSLWGEKDAMLCPTCRNAMEENYNRLEAERDQLKAALERAKEIAYEAPELNMANYDEEQVRDLNDAMIDVWHTLNKNTSTSLSQHDADVLRNAADALTKIESEPIDSTCGSFDEIKRVGVRQCLKELRRMADEMEKGKA